MDFDEYDYLEKEVEKKVSAIKVSANSNGAKSEEKKEGNRSSSKKHHRDDEPRDSNHHHRSKGRSKPEDERNRSSPRQRSPDRRPRDGEKDRPRDRRGRDMDRDERNGRDRGRMGEKVERGTEREEMNRSRRDDEDRERVIIEREEKERREQPRERNRDGRRYKAKKEEAAEPEADQERDQRTVFAYQICLKADERQVYEFFSSAGKVRDVRIIMDRNSGRSKGVGYVEFYDAMSVPMAISLSGQPLLGQAVMVKPSEAEKNLIQPTSAAAVVAGGLTMPYSGGLRRLYVGNLHSNITEDQLRQVFEPFGALELVQLPLDPETGHCKGFGFIQFARLEDARNAQSLNGQLDIAGRTVKVSAVTDQEGVPDVGANAGDFDDDEGGGLALNARSRALLMQKLDRSGTATSAGCGLLAPTASGFGSSVAASSLHPILPVLAGLQDPSKPVALISPVETVGTPSECLWLKNMFDPSVETEPDFHLDIKEDVQDECSKFGTVKHIFVDKNSAGHVYLRFDSITSAMNAQRALHGRWFAGKMITTTFMVPLNYEGKFPSSS